jgi:regulator of protease activity HflC (stomatin/prohibitin superfamily)
MSGCPCIVCIQTSEVGIVERLGKFSRIVTPGINLFCCPVEYVAETVSLRVQQLNVMCETKTLDNVFVQVQIVVQYKVRQDKVFDAYYKLDQPKAQIQAYVFDTVRSVLPTMELDSAFEAKEEIALEVKKALKETMDSFGFEILQCLVTDLNPDAKVKAAMNQINEATRMREANKEKAEGEKILLVKAAEADCDAKKLSGEGVAKQRKAIVDGLRDSILDFSGGKEGVQGTSPKDVIDLLLLTQYFDMLKDVGSQAGTSTVFLPPDSAPVRDGILQANAMAR